MKKMFFPISVLLLSLVLSGCVTPKNSATIPNFKQEYKVKKNIIVVPPKVKMFEVSNAGEEEIIEWSKIATTNMKNSLNTIIPNSNLLSYKDINYDLLDEENKQIIDSTNNLMYRISPSINSHALNTSFSKFDDKIENFDYTIGDALSNFSSDGDLYLFINTFDKVQTGGKKTVETAKLIIGALLGIAAGDIGGVTYSCATLVDSKTGKILWYNYYISKGQVDLREKEGTDIVVKALLDDLQNQI